MIAIDPRHDPDALARSYAANGRLQIRDFLAGDDAGRLRDILMYQTPWGVAFNRGAQTIQVSAEQAASLTPELSAQLLEEIHHRAREGYQFLYHFYPLYARFLQAPQAGEPLFEAFAFVNSAPFLDFMRRMTGLADIRWADAHASLYRAGHFLKYHTDETPAERRLAAYVLNFTEGWGRDWGGYLQFFDAKYDIEEAYRPIFNAVNVFTVPADHSVGMIAGYAPSGRYSITGWLRADDPPAPVAALHAQ